MEVFKEKRGSNRGLKGFRELEKGILQERVTRADQQTVERARVGQAD